MRIFRNPAFVMATAVSIMVAMYIALVANRALLLIRIADPVSKALGLALMLLPFLGAWWLVNEWRLGISAQRMATLLQADGRLAVDEDAPRRPSGRLTDDASHKAFEVAKREAEAHPDDWAAWFLVAQAYEDARDRTMARKTMRHAADLFRRTR